MNTTSGVVRPPNPAEGQSIDELLRTLRVLWFGLLMGQILFVAVLVFMVGNMSREPVPVPVPLAALFYSLLGVAVLAAIVGPTFLERSFVSSLRERSSEIKRAADPVIAAQADYRGFFVKRHGLAVGASFAGGLTYIITAKTAVLAVPAASILWFLLNYPTEDRVRQQIQRALESA